MPARWIPGLAALFIGESALADKFVIDKIYHPYVQPLEQEFEWRMSMQNRQPGFPDDLRHQRLGYARSLGDRWLGEIYLVGQSSGEAAFDIESWELEVRRQLTEQGQYWADWGFMFEAERASHVDTWRVSAGMLVEKGWRKWSATGNFFLDEGWGSDFDSGLEARVNLQLRYRLSPSFEPAIEFYGGQDTHGVGPVVLGQLKLGGRRQLSWETGAIFGLDHTSPDLTLRFLLEYEF